MSIPVTCRSCSAAFSVKDEYAGKRVKCPSCKEPLTIPGMADTVKMPAPAKPVVASRPKPAEVDEAVEDTPKPKRRRDEEEQDDDAPRQKRQREEDDEDAPKSRRRRRDEDDDTPKKKGSVLPLILGLVGGVLLLGGGITAAVLFSQGAGQGKPSDTTPRISPEDSGTVGIPPLSPKMFSTDELVNGIERYRGQTVSVKGAAEFVGGEGKKGSIILRGGAMKTQIVCNFEDTGNYDKPLVGEVMEIRGVVEPGSSVAQVRLKDCVLLNGKPYTPPSALSVEALLKDPAKHAGKVVVVTGKVGSVLDLVNPPVIQLDGTGEDFLTCTSSPKGWGKVPQAGATVSIRGRVQLVEKFEGGKKCTLEECEVVPAK